MKIVYCCPGHDTGCEKVRRIIEILVAADAFETFHVVKDFEKFLRHDLTSAHLVILHASTPSHLESFVSLRDLLIGHKVILILPDRERETVISGHTLRPRFITYNDSDYLEMASVLCHIINPQAGENRTTP
jgi:hypothetical protein